MSFWDSAWSAVSDAASWLGDAASSTANWMSNNKEATNLIGSTLLGVGSYLAQKEANKDLMKQQRELLNMQDKLKSQYSAEPDVDISYKTLTVDNSPGLANGGILTEMKNIIRERNHEIYIKRRYRL